jgi:hypothetical protein
MPWNETAPNDFSKFTPVDFLRFLAWWEMQQGNLLAIELLEAYIQGTTQPWLEPISTPIPAWIETMMQVRMVGQWAYQSGVPVSARLKRLGLEGLAADEFEISPQAIAEVPPEVRQAFLEGIKFSLGWIEKLSDDARSQMRDIIAVNNLKNRSSQVAVPMLEQILRRELVAKELGLDSVTNEQVQEWLEKAKFEVVEAIARRAELISQTESMRMMNLGILSALEQKGEKLVYIMPHRGTCPDCQRLLDGRVFRISVLKENLFKNFGYSRDKWVASVPQHPRCRHSVMSPPYGFMKSLSDRLIPSEGLVLEWYGLPGGKEAIESLGLKKTSWLKKTGEYVNIES